MASHVEDAYIARQRVYNELGDSLTTLLAVLLDHYGIEGVTISYRVKTLSSARAKVERLGGSIGLNDLTDILGVRVEPSFGSEIDVIANVIAHEFEIISTSDRGPMSAQDNHGPTGVHYVLRLGAPRRQLHEWAPYAGLSWELQVTWRLGSILRTVEQVLRDKGVQALDPYTRSSIIALLEYVHDSRISAFRRILGRFEELLNSSPREEVLQQFLTSNTVLLEPSVQRIRPKVRLGSEFVTDFVMELADEEYVLVEIEPAHFKLFTEAGNPSAQLMHAQRQVEDWREWISENIAYIRQTLPGLHDPMGLVVIGRRRDLSRAHIRSLRRKNTELHRIRIETYDDLLDRARRYIRNLQPDVASND